MEKGLTHKKPQWDLPRFIGTKMRLLCVVILSIRYQNSFIRYVRDFCHVLDRKWPWHLLPYHAKMKTWIVVHPNSMLYSLVIYLANLLTLAHDMRLFFSKEHTLLFVWMLFDVLLFVVFVWWTFFLHVSVYNRSIPNCTIYFAVSNGPTPTTFTKLF